MKVNHQKQERRCKDIGSSLAFLRSLFWESAHGQNGQSSLSTSLKHILNRLNYLLRESSCRNHHGWRFARAQVTPDHQKDHWGRNKRRRNRADPGFHPEAVSLKQDLWHARLWLKKENRESPKLLSLRRMGNCQSWNTN